MQIVIDIPEEKFSIIKSKTYCGIYDADLYKDIANGTPQPKTGHWILTDDDFVYCSECEDSYYERPIDASWYYCPHCGAKMESGV